MLCFNEKILLLITLRTSSAFCFICVTGLSSDSWWCCWLNSSETSSNCLTTSLTSKSGSLLFSAKNSATTSLDSPLLALDISSIPLTSWSICSLTVAGVSSTGSAVVSEEYASMASGSSTGVCVGPCPSSASAMLAGSSENSFCASLAIDSATVFSLTGSSSRSLPPRKWRVWASGATSWSVAVCSAVSSSAGTTLESTASIWSESAGNWIASASCSACRDSSDKSSLASRDSNTFSLAASCSDSDPATFCVSTSTGSLEASKSTCDDISSSCVRGSNANSGTSIPTLLSSGLTDSTYSSVGSLRTGALDASIAGVSSIPSGSSDNDSIDSSIASSSWLESVWGWENAELCCDCSPALSNMSGIIWLLSLLMASISKSAMLSWPLNASRSENSSSLIKSSSCSSNAEPMESIGETISFSSPTIAFRSSSYS